MEQIATVSQLDEPNPRSYDLAMKSGEPYVRLTLNVPQAIELGDFVAAFTALSAEYQRFVERDGSLSGSAQATLYVEEIRQGSIMAILAPWLPVFVSVADAMERILVVEQFVKLYGGRLRQFLVPGLAVPKDSKPRELDDFLDQVAAIANTPNSTLEIAAIEIENGDHKVRAAFKFDTGEARTIRERVEIAKHQISHRSGETVERALMVFTRTDVGTPALGQGTGERVKVESLSDKRLPLIYASELAEERIKFEIREASENVYKKGFVVDLYVETRNGKPAAYKVSSVHDVIDLED